MDVDRDLELQEAKRTAAQTQRDQLLARVNAARCRPQTRSTIDLSVA